MANSRFTNIYKILKDNNFDSTNVISSDYLCTICNKILINAHSAPCGCRYCLECITAYLIGEDKCCPGNTDDCKIDLLNINNNIHIDQSVNVKISRLIVKCPEGRCNEKMELRKLEDHIRVCNLRPTNCPFYNVGCRNVQMSNDKMEQHILSENHEHTKLLMDCIDILRNEVGELKEEMREMRKIKVEMREIRVEVKEKQIVIDELRAVIAQQSCEIDLLGEEIVALGNVNRRMEDQINGLGTKIESYEAANLEMRNKEEDQMNEMAQMNDIFKQMGEEGKTMRICHDKMSTSIDEISEQIVQMSAKSDIEYQAIEDVNFKIFRLEERVIVMAAQQNQLNYGEFVWPIDNFSDKSQKAQNATETRIFSDPFFSHKNGYKMCLSIDPDGFGDGKGTHLSIFIQLMRGPFDDILQWPFKYHVTFAIVNQQTRLNHFSKMLKYENSLDTLIRGKPITEGNLGGGFDQFIKLDELLNNKTLCDNDRIFIKCTVQIF